MGMYASLSKGDLIEMNNKKLSRLLEPNLKLYFLCMIVFAAATATVSLPLGLVEIACTVGLYAYFTNRNQKRRQNILQYIDNVTGSVDTASKSTLINSPLPIMVFRPDTGEVIWSNENFLQLAGVREHLFEMKVEDAVPDFPVQWMLEGKQECPDRVVMNSRRFRVYGSLVRAKGRGAEQNLVATTYWVDTTEADDLRERYTATRPVLAILMVDNYEDLMKACADTQRSAVLAQIDEKLNNWAACADGLLLKTERDHYLFIFEECHYDHFVEEKFSILDAIREIKVGDVCPTLSIGIGKDADAMAELYRNARLSLEMALSRGGDQAVVRGKVDFQFYGGRSKSTEKRTKVKSRVMASALNELMADASEIYIMGHSFADMDAVGAEAGLYCIARKHGKRAQMVIDLEHNAAGAVLAKLQALPEYAGAFTSGAEAFLKMRPGALVIVVDTNRPDMVESPQLLESSNRVAVIDHHRRAASYIENAAFSFHEPYASSASELVTELLQYLVEPADLLREEAEALLAGIVLDTKHFTLRTGGRLPPPGGGRHHRRPAVVPERSERDGVPLRHHPPGGAVPGGHRRGGHRPGGRGAGDGGPGGGRAAEPQGREGVLCGIPQWGERADVRPFSGRGERPGDPGGPGRRRQLHHCRRPCGEHRCGDGEESSAGGHRRVF